MSEIQNPTLFQSVLKFSFIGSSILFLICIICIALHFMGVPIFSFVAGDKGIISIPVPTTTQTAFANSPIPSDTSCDFIGILSTGYSISFDVFLQGDFITTKVPRVLLYRAMAPVVLASTDSMDSLQMRFGGSNILVYMDPLTNDLYVAALKTDSTYAITEPIKNVPLRSPFRITLVVSDNFLEVYMNGELKQMLPFNGEIVSSPSAAKFFGPPPIVNQSIKVGNIQAYNSILSSKLVRMFGQQKISTTLFAAYL